MHLWGYRCHRCGHEWLPRRDRPPKVCRIRNAKVPTGMDRGRMRRAHSQSHPVPPPHLAVSSGAPVRTQTPLMTDTSWPVGDRRNGHRRGLAGPAGAPQVRQIRGARCSVSTVRLISPIIMVTALLSGERRPARTASSLFSARSCLGPSAVNETVELVQMLSASFGTPVR